MYSSLKLVIALGRFQQLKNFSHVQSISKAWQPYSKRVKKIIELL